MRYVLIFVLCAVSIFSSCKKEEDSCDDKVCGPNETCVDGLCKCPEHYRGVNCRDQESPSKIFIHQLEILRFPGGNAWDLGNGPDLYITIYQSTTALWKLPTVIQNADSSIKYKEVISPAIEITDLTGQYTISMYDDDGMLTDQFMAGVLFTPYSNSNQFSSELIVDTGGLVAYKLTLSYEW